MFDHQLFGIPNVSLNNSGCQNMRQILGLRNMNPLYRTDYVVTLQKFRDY